MSIKHWPSRVREKLNGNSLYWRWFTNLGPTLAWRRLRRPLSAVQQRVVADLRENGIASVHVDELFEERGTWEEVSRAAEELEKTHAAEIQHRRDNPDPAKGKDYLFRLLGAKPVLDPDSVFVRLGIHQAVLGMAQAYFGMFVRLNQFNVWHNLPAYNEPKASQLWHTDPEDRQILRLFLYLRDVGPGSGPLSYIPGSHALGRRQVKPEMFLQDSTMRSTDEQMSKVSPPANWVTATAKQGTMWFVDTRGYHKGGHVRDEDRIVYNAMWTSRANTRGEYFVRNGPLAPQADPGVAYALRAPVA
ncbi:MAG: phytanoyl-CoA dioxygenase family protein [Planctomycetes bacterium]|nr:phytanoyl-CoA dioxygenase family protein [Planctomycetota bacterium]